MNGLITKKGALGVGHPIPQILVVPVPEIIRKVLERNRVYVQVSLFNIEWL